MTQEEIRRRRNEVGEKIGALNEDLREEYERDLRRLLDELKEIQEACLHPDEGIRGNHGGVYVFCPDCRSDRSIPRNPDAA